MKKSLYILIGAALLVAMTSCEPKYEYKWSSYVVMNDTAVSVAEDAGTVTLGVTAYPQSGTPNLEVQFLVEDGDGENGAKDGVDYTIVSPANQVLVFSGDTTVYITFRISDANVGIYTGRKQFKVTLLAATNGYELGGAYYTTVTITDTDKNLEGDTIYGTYNANGDAYSDSGPVNQNWELLIIADETNPDLVYIDGLCPSFTDMYATYGTDGVPYGYLDNDDTELHVPTQVLNLKASGYYLGYMACTQYDDGYYYSSQYPDIVFYKNSDGTWTSDYGVFLMACETQDITTASAFFDVVIPSITLTKID